MRPQFRLTLWFKKGSLDADQARVAADGDDALHPGAVDLLPAEDRYLDDGSVSREDSHVFSLRTGHTTMLPNLGRVAHGSAPPPSGDTGGDVAPLVAELKTGRLRVIGALAAVAALGVTLALAFL